MDRTTLGERASHGQIYLRRDSQPWTDQPDKRERERASHGQIYPMRERESQPWTDLSDERAMDRSTL